jgi:hypothetical protein
MSNHGAFRVHIHNNDSCASIFADIIHDQLLGILPFVITVLSLFLPRLTGLHT